MWLIKIFVILFFLFTKAMLSTDNKIDLYAKNSIYFDLTYLIFSGSASLNYERIISRTSSIRAGIGGAFTAFPNVAGGSVGSDEVISTTIMYNYLTQGRYKFEAGIGLSLPLEGDYKHFIGNPIAMTLGYRYQHKENGGFIFRTGISWVYCYGLGLHLSIGKSF